MSAEYAETRHEINMYVQSVLAMNMRLKIARQQKIITSVVIVMVITKQVVKTVLL